MKTNYVDESDRVTFIFEKTVLILRPPFPNVIMQIVIGPLA